MQNIDFSPSPAKQPKLTKALAESLAVEVLGFLARDPATIGRFLSVSGLEPGGVRAAAEESGFLAAVLDYLACDEGLLLAFAKSAGHDPATLVKARELLSPPAEEGI